MRLILFIISVSIFCSCEGDREKVVEGDLYFKLFDIDRYFDGPSLLSSIENGVRGVNRDTLNFRDKKVYDAFKFMMDNNLLRKPYVRLMLDNEEIKILLLDSSDYRQFIKYNWVDLSRRKEKVRVKVIVKEFEYPIFLMKKTETAYNALRLLSIDKIEGDTHWTK